MLLDFMGLDQIGLSHYWEFISKIEKKEVIMTQPQLLPGMVIQILKAVYPILRPLIQKAVTETDNPWDNTLLLMFDSFLSDDVVK